MGTSSDVASSCDGQQAEISLLRDHFKDKIRILSSIGQFSYILKIHPDQYDVSLTLQLDQYYPSKVPEIIITAPRLTPDQIILIQQNLQSYSETLLNQPMVLLIYGRLLQWFTENNIQTLGIRKSHYNRMNSSSSSTQRLQKANKINSSPTSSDDNESTKQPSMKTAEDVISRIEWDVRLDKRYFRVGYLDRFLGLQEKSFNDFDFKVDLSTISDRHSTILAIPKHRIQYFKYDNEIVWDKETRTDLVFGSTGNQETIYDVIQRHQQPMENNHNNSSPTPDNTTEETTVSIDDPCSQRYLTITDGVYKPNYYLSIPITDSQILAQYTTYQEHLFLSYPSTFSMHSEFSKLHLTILTLRMETPSQFEQCITILRRLENEIRRYCSDPEPLCLEFRNISTFHDKTVYIKCNNNQRLDDLRTLIVKRFSEEKEKEQYHNIVFAGNYFQFIPHITLLNCKRKFSSVCQDETKEIYFGQQQIHSLLLRPIGKHDNDAQSVNGCTFQMNLN